MPNCIEFNGTTDFFTYGFQAPEPQLLGATTLMIVLRIMTTSDLTWLSFLEDETSGGLNRPSIGRRNDGNIYYSDSVTLTSAIAVEDADNWMVIAVTRPAGAAQTVRMHKCVIGGSNTHTDAAGTFSDSSAYPGGLYRIAGNDDFANIRVVAAATWTSAALTDGQLNGIAAAKTSQSILDLSPSWMVEAGDSLVLDRSVGGNTDRSAAVGGAANTDTPAGWVYLGGAVAGQVGTMRVDRIGSRRTSW